MITVCQPLGIGLISQALSQIRGHDPKYLEGKAISDLQVDIYRLEGAIQPDEEELQGGARDLDELKAALAEKRAVLQKS